MISKLLDEPYWDELEEVISDLMGDNYILFDPAWSSQRRYNRRGESSWGITNLLKFDDSIMTLAQAEYLVYHDRNLRRRDFFNKKQVIHYCKKRLPLIRSQLIKSIRRAYYIATVAEDNTIKESWIKYLKQLEKNDNIHQIFMTHKKLLEIKKTRDRDGESISLEALMEEISR